MLSVFFTSVTCDAFPGRPFWPGMLPLKSVISICCLEESPDIMVAQNGEHLRVHHVI